MRIAAAAAAVLAVALAATSAGWAQQAPPTSPTPPRPLTVLYDSLPDRALAERLDQLDASPFTIQYQTAVIGTGADARIDARALVEAVRTRLAGTRPRWGMLDFESPFTERLASGPDSRECAEAVQTLVEAMRAVRAEFPETRWSYYNAPTVPYWFEGKNWETAPPEVRVRMLDRLYKVYAPIVSELDWVSTSLYPVYDPAKQPVDQGAANIISGRAWRTNAVGLARILAQGKPVIPTISPLWMPGGFAMAGSRVSHERFMTDLVNPLLDAKVDGFALWTGADYFIHTVANGDPASGSAEKGYGASVMRDAVAHDYLDGQAPPNWNDPAIVSMLKARMSETILDAVRAIRAAEARERAPNTTEPLR